jgi:hypothetical protein
MPLRTAEPPEQRHVVLVRELDAQPGRRERRDDLGDLEVAQGA